MAENLGAFELIKRVKAQDTAVQSVVDERDLQDVEFGKQVHDPVYWFAVLGKQVGQLGESVIDHKWAADRDAARKKMYREAQQVAAVAVALMEACLLDECPDEITSAKPRDPRQKMVAMGRGHEALNYDEDNR